MMTFRLETALSELDTLGIPANRTSQLGWILRCFPYAFRIDLENGSPRLAEDDVGVFAWTWNLFEADFDGESPRDYGLFYRNEGSIGYYGMFLIVRSDTDVTYQDIAGSVRGRNNMLGRARSLSPERFDLFLRESGYASNPSDLNGDRRDDLLVHNSVVIPVPEDLWSMAALTDVPTPFFWNGEEMRPNSILAQPYYGRLLAALKYLAPEDSTVIAAKIDSTMGTRRQ